MTKRTQHQGEPFPLFFAFPDGVYHHVCAECTALCCRGHGFAGSLQREMTTLYSIYPSLQSMAIARHGEIVTFLTPANGCVLLDSDNMCRIEKEHGKALKPGVCNLFPFNSFTLIGKTIAVSPHFLCPLRLIIPARPGHVEGTHSRLEAAVHESALLGGDYLKSQMKSVRFHPSMDADSVLAREGGFRDRCSQALGERSFDEILINESSNPDEFRTVVERALKVLGWENPSKPSARDGIDDLMLALAPPLRLGLLHLSSEAILRGLKLSELIVRRVSALSGSPLTPQGAHSTLGNLGHAIRLLARGDEPLEHPNKVTQKAPPFGDPDMAFAAFIALREIRASTGALSAMEKAIGPSISVADRSVLLNQLGAMIEHTPSRRRKKDASNETQSADQ